MDPDETGGESLLLDETPAEGETSTEETSTEEEKTEEETAEGAPEEYAEFTAPEGVTLNADLLDKFKAFARDNNMTQERAQALVDMGVEIASSGDKALADHIAQTRADWRKASQNDEEFGDNAWESTRPLAKAGLDRFGTPALRSLLEESGLGDHPEVIRLFWKIGQATGEHAFVKSGKHDGARASFYDHPTSKAN